jgi:hypothetical protein
MHQVTTNQCNLFINIFNSHSSLTKVTCWIFSPHLFISFPSLLIPSYYLPRLFSTLSFSSNFLNDLYQPSFLTLHTLDFKCILTHIPWYFTSYILLPRASLFTLELHSDALFTFTMTLWLWQTWLGSKTVDSKLIQTWLGSINDCWLKVDPNLMKIFWGDGPFT